MADLGFKEQNQNYGMYPVIQFYVFSVYFKNSVKIKLNILLNNFIFKMKNLISVKTENLIVLKRLM